MSNASIGVFDSGYGGLSVLKTLRARLPQQSFVYLGDHQNAPYGPRSPEQLYDLTTTNLDWLFKQDCRLALLACNTASSVLRRIQHEWLPQNYPDNRVLGIIVPTVEMITEVPWDMRKAPKANEAVATVGVFATEATVTSKAYPLEIKKRAPQIRVVQQACPMLVSLIEGHAPGKKIEEVVKEYIEKLKDQLGGGLPDYVLLGCTHYALISQLFHDFLASNVRIINQPDCVAASLENYLNRHPEYKSKVPASTPLLYTTGEPNKVNETGQGFLFDNLSFKTASAGMPSNPVTSAPKKAMAS